MSGPQVNFKVFTDSSSAANVLDNVASAFAVGLVDILPGTSDYQRVGDEVLIVRVDLTVTPVIPTQVYPSNMPNMFFRTLPEQVVRILLVLDRQPDIDDEDPYNPPVDIDKILFSNEGVPPSMSLYRSDSYDRFDILASRSMTLPLFFSSNQFCSASNTPKPYAESFPVHFKVIYDRVLNRVNTNNLLLFVYSDLDEADPTPLRGNNYTDVWKYKFSSSVIYFDS